MVMRLIVLLSLLLFSAVASAKGLTASVDRNQLGLGEQLALTVTLTDIKGRRPDTSGLLQNFSIDGQSQRSNYKLINGILDQEASWTFTLTPNRKGTLTIPAFKIGRFSSDPIKITVTDMPVAQSTSDDVLMEVAVSPASPYVQSQVAYIQRLYFSRPLVDRAAISRPKLSKGEADIQFWGASDPRYVTHKGRPYQLIERYYIFYPRKAGVLEFEPSAFNGSLASSQQRNDFQMNRFRNGTRVSAYSEKASLVIKEKPASYTSEHWLPASQVTLNMNLSPRPETLEAGEPLTVTIALMAEGLKAEVLPEVKLDLPAGVKSYPEKPTFRTDKVANGMVGQRQDKIVLIANKAGEYVIPEVKVAWWSVTEDKQKVATLDAVVLKVIGGVVSQQPKPDDTSSTGAGAGSSELNDKDIGEDQGPAEGDKAELETPVEKATPLLATFSSGLMGFYQLNKRMLLIGLSVAVCLIGLAWVVLRRRKARLLSGEYQQQLATGDAMSALEQACKQNNPQTAIAALSKWAEVMGIYPATMSGIEMAGDARLSAAVGELTAANYSPNPEVWSGAQLYKAASQYAQAKQTIPQSSLGLRPLHPVSS